MTLQEQLTRDEGLRLKPYTDTVGKVTIGIGRNLTDVGISRDEALAMLANDIKNAQERLAASLPWTAALDEVRRGAVENMAFNLGIGRLLNFRKFLAALEARDYQTAAKEMLSSSWATQVGDRARRLSKQIESGEWQ